MASYVVEPCQKSWYRTAAPRWYDGLHRYRWIHTLQTSEAKKMRYGMASPGCSAFNLQLHAAIVQAIAVGRIDAYIHIGMRIYCQTLVREWPAGLKRPR